MQQIRTLIEKIADNVVEDPKAFAESATREQKDVVIFNIENDTSVLIVLRQGDATTQGSLDALKVSDLIRPKDVRFLNDAGKVVDSCITVKKNPQGGPVTLTGLWSINPRSSMILYCVALRSWRKIKPDLDPSDSVKTLLNVYAQATDQIESAASKTYVCPPIALLVNINDDIRIVDVNRLQEDSTDLYDVLGGLMKDTYMSKLSETDKYTAESLGAVLKTSAAASVQNHILKGRHEVMTVKESQDFMTRFKHPLFQR